MKRALFLIATVALALSWATAQITPLPLQAKDARSIAMGGAFTALSSGYQSLYGNPAGFGLGRAKLTLANASVWGYVKPSSDNIGRLMNLGDAETSELMGTMNDLITQNGLGFGAAVGAGLVGGGLGIGATMVTEQYARGNTIMGTNFTSATQANVVLGLAIPFGSDRFGLRIGGDLRPFMRIDGSFPAWNLIEAMANGDDPIAVIGTQPALYGLGIAADLGAQLSFGSLSAGIAIRDLAPPFSFTATNFETAIGGSVVSDPAAEKGQFLPNITFGLGWAPRLIPFILEPSLYFEVQDPLRASQDESVFWNLLHVGGEVKLLSFMYLRGGLSQGWMTAGAGINLLILQLDFAAFTDEMGRHPGDKPRSGVAANVRLHL
jgi:hypothetical protein